MQCLLKLASYCWIRLHCITQLFEPSSFEYQKLLLNKVKIFITLSYIRTNKFYLRLDVVDIPGKVLTYIILMFLSSKYLLQYFSTMILRCKVNTSSTSYTRKITLFATILEETTLITIKKVSKKFEVIFDSIWTMLRLELFLDFS